MQDSKPTTQFTRAGDVAIAYQVVGDGPVDLIYASGWLHNIDVVWEHPGYRRFILGLAETCRVILFDKRGTGMSDRNVGVATLEERTEDIRAVMAAVGSEKAAIFGISEGGNMAAMFAACYPEKVSSIVMIGCRPCLAWKPDWPHGQRRDEFETGILTLEQNWGDLGYNLAWAAPSVQDDPEECAFFNRLLVQSASPGSAIALTRLNYEIDIRPILPSIKAPALILHPEKDISVTEQEGRYLADQIPEARFAFVKNSDHLPWIGETDGIVRQITEFVCSEAPPPKEDRVLATILMTDIVQSTATAVEMGDARWRETLKAHDEAAARSVARNNGRLIKTMGDGILATFEGPSRAIACASDFQRDVGDLGLQVRAGVHTGECLRHGQDVTGLAVTIAARLMDLAPADTIWVSGIVRGLVVGSGLTFASVGTKALKGVPDDWEVFQVAS